MKIKTSIALTQETIKLIKELSKKMGVSQSGVIEIAVQKMDELERVSEAATMLGITAIEMMKVYQNVKEGVEESIEEIILRVYQDELKKPRGSQDLP